MQERLKQILVEPPKNHTDAKKEVCSIFLCVSFVDHIVIRLLYVMAIAVSSQGLSMLHQP